jgi:hypothetical protein
LTAEELVQAAYPSGANALPTNPGYHYWNTNYVFAGMIAERAAGRSYRDLVHEMVIDATGPTSTFYENGTYPAAVAGQIGKPVDLAKQVIVGDMPLNAEAVEQRLLHHPPLAHEALLFPSEELSTFPRQVQSCWLRSTLGHCRPIRKFPAMDRVAPATAKRKFTTYPVSVGTAVGLPGSPNKQLCSLPA